MELTIPRVVEFKTGTELASEQSLSGFPRWGRRSPLDAQSGARRRLAFLRLPLASDARSLFGLDRVGDGALIENVFQSRE